MSNEISNQFSIDATFVALNILRQLEREENENKSIRTFLEEYNLYENKHVIISPPFLINTLYGVLLNMKEDFNKNQSKNAGIDFNGILKKYIEVKFNNLIDGNDKPYALSRCIRNSIAHYNIKYISDGSVKFYCNGEKGEKDIKKFYAVISRYNLVLLINELGELKYNFKI